MGAVLTGGCYNASINSGFFAGPVGGPQWAVAVESQVVRTAHVPGTFSNFGASVNANGTARLLQFRKNSAPANQSLSFPDSVAATVYDNVHSDHYTTAQNFSLANNQSTSAFVANWIKNVFTADSGHASYYGGTLGSSPSTATIFVGLGSGGSVMTVEANTQTVMQTSGTWEFLAVFVAVATTTTATVVSRKNGASGNQTVSITANTTGTFADNTHTDSYVSGDALNWQISGHSAGLGLQSGGVQCNIAFSGLSSEVISGGNDVVGASQNASDQFIAIIGAQAATSAFITTTESVTQIQHGFGLTASQFRNLVTTNASNVAWTCKTRINGADGKQVLTIPANTTGNFTDSVNTDTVLATDNFNYVLRGGQVSSGQIIFGYFALTEGPLPQPPSFDTPHFLFSPGRGPQRGLRPTLAFPSPFFTINISARAASSTSGNLLPSGSVALAAQGKDAATGSTNQTFASALAAAVRGALVGKNAFSSLSVRVQALLRSQLTSRVSTATTSALAALGKAAGSARLAAPAGAVPLSARAAGAARAKNVFSSFVFQIQALTRGQSAARAGAAFAASAAAAARAAGSARSALVGAGTLSARAAAQASGRTSSPTAIVLVAIARGAVFARAVISGAASLAARGATRDRGAAATSGVSALAARARALAAGRGAQALAAAVSSAGRAASYGKSTGSSALALSARALASAKAAAQSVGVMTLLARAASALRGRLLTVAGPALTAFARGAARGTPRISASPIALAASVRGRLAGQLARFLLPTLIPSRLITAPRTPATLPFTSLRVQGVTPLHRRLASSPLPVGTSSNRTLVTKPTIVPRRPSMPYGNDLSAVDPTVEKVTVTFDFSAWLLPGVTILSVTSVTALNAARSINQDPNPQNIITGGAQISALTGKPANTAVLQQVSQCQPNVTYLLQCLVATSDNQVLNLATHLPSNAID